jgi:hypothetical protein
MRADRERQTVTIHDRHDFQAFSSLRRTDGCSLQAGSLTLPLETAVEAQHAERAHVA